MKIPVDTMFLDAARHILPVIRDHNAETERERRLSKATLNALTDTGLLRMCTPRSLGGLEVDPLTCARVVEEVAGADSAAGWTLVNPLNYAFFCARLPDAGAEEIYRNGPNAVIAGPFHPPIQATPVPGGYRLTGRAPFASNCHDATWIARVAMVMEGEAPRLNASGAPELLLAMVPVEACEIIDTWYVMGMRGTGSDDIALTDVFVPQARTFPLEPEFTPGSHYRGPLYRFSAMGNLASTFPLVMLAMARQALNEVYTLAQGKTPFASTRLLRERTTAQVKLAQAEATLRAARALLYDTLSERWEQTRAGEPPSLVQRADLLLAVAHATSSAATVVELAYNVAGTSGIYTRNPLERHFRDVQVLKQHGFASEQRYETVSQVYFGLPPEFAPVAL
jgi:alkylation response protein AidB-like acyl-CoA dehydrogenase